MKPTHYRSKITAGQRPPRLCYTYLFLEGFINCISPLTFMKIYEMMGTQPKAKNAAEQDKTD